MTVKNFFAKLGRETKLFLLPDAENDYRARIFAGHFLIALFFAALLLKLGFAIFLYSFSNSKFYADITKTALVELANAERAKYNLPALTENETLNQAAYLKALDMQKNGYFSHVSPSGVNPWHWFDLAGYNYKYAGENLAIGFLDSKEVQKAWAASPTHEANIINNKYKEIGIAVLKANFQGNPATIVVQLFGANPLKSQNTQSAAPVASNRSPAPAGGQNASSTAALTAPKNVLGAATAAPDINSPGFKAALFFAQNYFGLVQLLIYGSIFFVIILLLVNFAMKADLDHADLLVKAIGFIAVMAVFSLFDQSLISALIPHQFLIE
jgi:hypothetical protein